MQNGIKKPLLISKGSSDVINGAEFIPVELGGILTTPTVPINELGKQLLKASVEGQLEEIKRLMNKGAPFTADWLGTSPLHFAAQYNYVDICELLLRAGISKDAKTKVDRTPLHIAAFEGHLEIIKCLLRYKADIECKDLLEMTPLHWAVQNEHAEVVSFLVSEGAQIQVINKFGLTPMEISMQCERYDILNILKSCVRDPMIAVQNLAIELNEMDGSNDSYSQKELVDTQQNSPSVLETVDLDSDNEGQVEYSDLLDEAIEDDDQSNCIIKEEVFQNETKLQTEDNRLTESFRILQQHGITLLPTDDSNILSSVLDLGHSVVLTDVGKEVLNSTKSVEPVAIEQPSKLTTLPITQKIITLTAEEFLAMASNQNKLKPINGNLHPTLPQKLRPPVKRIIMKKSKVVPFNNKVTKIFTSKHDNIMDVKMLIKQLADARSLAEEYRQKYLKKHEEAELYKQQIVMLMQNKS